ncbi:MAG: PD-(D/E)XK nuclease family protein [Epulopiscium sp.]|nr:PD-(D/E)XK nuclease family protein [Candidatus Epulonipiscium sp.]
MYNDSEMISASEINQFTYCAYQWYYARLYGPAKLRELAKERNEKYGYEDYTLSRFSKGNRFHALYHFWYRVKRVFILGSVGLLLIAIFYYIVVVMQSG